MIVRIKLLTDGYNTKNRLSKSRLDELIDFLGEDVRADQLKIDATGEFSSTNYRDTFDEEEAKEKEDYTLVTPADMYGISSNDNYLVDFETFTEKFPDLEFTIKGKPKSVGSTELGLFEEMKKVAKKIEDATKQFDKQVQYNQKCDVHVPNLGLMSINKLAYATNYCTEELQGLLYQGYKLIAVCPQPDQRRPDYILGMHVTELGEDVSVQHFSGNGKEE